MAKTSITNTKMSFNTAVAVPATVAVGSEGSEYIAEVNYKRKEDSRILVILENSDSSAAKTVTVKKGTGLQGVADLTIEVAASAKMAVVLESGKFINNDGNIVIAGTDTKVKVAAIELP